MLAHKCEKTVSLVYLFSKAECHLISQKGGSERETLMVSKRSKRPSSAGLLRFSQWLNGSNVVLGTYCHIITADVVLAGLHATQEQLTWFWNACCSG